MNPKRPPHKILKVHWKKVLANLNNGLVMKLTNTENANQIATITNKYITINVDPGSCITFIY